MSEKSVVEPLSGTEVVDAIKYKVGEQLARDCFMSGNMAYESFEATVHIRIKMKDVGHNPEVDKVIKIHGGPAIPETFKDPEDAALVHVEESEEHYEGEPANDVRVATDQPVPVLVEGTDGRKEIKRVSYKKQKPDRTTPNPANGGAQAVELPDAE